MERKIEKYISTSETKKKALRELRVRIRRGVSVYWIPTNSLWLKLVDPYFAILQHTGLYNTNYKTQQEIRYGGL